MCGIFPSISSCRYPEERLIDPAGVSFLSLGIIIMAEICSLA